MAADSFNHSKVQAANRLHTSNVVKQADVFESLDMHAHVAEVLLPGALRLLHTPHPLPHPLQEMSLDECMCP
jgi:hypothetical protein